MQKAITKAAYRCSGRVYEGQPQNFGQGRATLNHAMRVLLGSVPIAMVDRALACGFKAVIDAARRISGHRPLSRAGLRGRDYHPQSAKSAEAAGQDRFIFTSTTTTAETAALRRVVRPRLQPTAAMLASIKMWRKRSQC